MIFDILKRKWLHEEFIKYDARKEERTVRWPQSIVIIVDATRDQDTGIFETWAERLKIAKENMTVIGRCKSVKKSLAQGMQLVDGSFIKMFGGVANQELAQLLDQPVDLQINYFDEETGLLHYLARRTNAAFRVGFTHHQEALYDLSLDMPTNDPQGLMTEVIKYLKIITT